MGAFFSHKKQIMIMEPQVIALLREQLPGSSARLPGLFIGARSQSSSLIYICMAAAQL
jgi:hypothetical protein